jgi:hypothetical protein
LRQGCGGAVRFGRNIRAADGVYYEDGTFMIDTLSAAATPRRRGLASRVVGVVTSPRATYADIAARPSWLGGLVVVLLATILPTMWILSTEVGRKAGVDLQLQTLEAFGRTVSDEEYLQMQRMAPYAPYLSGASQVVAVPLFALIAAGILYAVFSGVSGGKASYRQVFAVVVFSNVLTAARAVFSAPLNYARESLSSPTNLAAVLPLFDDNTFGAILFGAIDLFLIWWIVNLAIGVGVLYNRRTAPVAGGMLCVYGAIALAIAAVRSVLAGA